MALLNVTCNVCMFQDSFELSIEKKWFPENWFEIVVWFFFKWLMCPKNSFEKKVCFHVFKFYVFLLFCTFFKVISWTNITIYSQIWDPIFITVFPKLFFLFCIQSSKLCRNMRKLRVTLSNATIYPPWGPVKKEIKNVLLPHLKC